MEKQDDQKGNPDKKTVTIHINGTEMEWEKGDISFEEVVAFAFPEESKDPLVIFKVTYERAHGNQEGILNKGDSIKVKEGTSFDATNTGRS
ncbi:MAG: multiubiquitin domain-containing protein [Flavisolibacter sp.]